MLEVDDLMFKLEINNTPGEYYINIYKNYEIMYKIPCPFNVFHDNFTEIKDCCPNKIIEFLKKNKEDGLKSHFNNYTYKYIKKYNKFMVKYEASTVDHFVYKTVLYMTESEFIDFLIVILKTVDINFVECWNDFYLGKIDESIDYYNKN